MDLDANGKFVFPSTAYDAGNYALLSVNIALIPFFRLFFADIQKRSHYATREDWYRSYQAFAEIEEMLMSGSLQQLIEGQNRLYRLFDTSFNGVVYTATTDQDTQITTVTPDQPVVPAATVGVAPGLRRQLLDMQGIINAGWFGIGGQPATLADVVNSLRVGSAGQKQTILDTLRSLLATGASAASILSLIESLFADTVDGLGEGAILATLITTSIANVGMLDSLSTQISRLITSLDGGTIPAPGDNVLMALRGITEASETRNVIDSTGATGATLTTIADNLAAIETNTTTITDDNVLLLTMLTDVRDLLV